MPQANVIRWRDGAGWLVMCGGGDFASGETGEVEAEALTRVQPGDPIAYIWAAGDVETADKHLAELDDLGGPTGYLVDILTEDDDTLRQQLSAAGLIVIGDGPNLKALRSGLLGAALEAIGEAFERGAVILGMGQSAALLGSWLENLEGIAWVEGAIIVTNYERSDQPAHLRQLLLNHPKAYGLGIGSGSALALGPNGEVESWGERKITITLGKSFG
jgi:hypothetical protein